jgi:hypothetical protein
MLVKYLRLDQQECGMMGKRIGVRDFLMWKIVFGGQKISEASKTRNGECLHNI